MTAKECIVLRILFKGRVQGVGFRQFVLHTANQYAVRGWVRNRSEGDVECEAEGTRDVLEQFYEAVRKGPSMSRVDEVQPVWSPGYTHFSDFQIR